MEAGSSHRVDDFYDDMPSLISEAELRAQGQGDEDPGAQSDASIPSLQTVSDSDEETDDDESDLESHSDSFSESDSDDNISMPPLESPPSDTRDRPRRVNEGSGIPPIPPPPPLHTFDFYRNGGTPGSESPFGNLPSRALRGFMLEQVLNASDVRDYGGPNLSNIFGNIGNLSPDFVLDHILMAHLHHPSEPDDDPLRADTIISCLEVVSEEHIARYEKLRSGSEEDEFEGCAICRDVFIPEDFVESPLPAKGSAEYIFSQLPFDKIRVSPILAFPCPGMHIFHENCISPWLARKTTCPTCRFDVDPQSLTLRIVGRSRSEPVSRQRKAWEPPKSKGFLNWLQREEDKRNGIPVPPSPPLPPTSTRANISPPLPPYLLADPDDDDDDEEWITDDEDMSHYYTPPLLRLPPSPPPLDPVSDSDDDDDGPPPLVGETEDNLPIPLSPRPAPTRIPPRRPHHHIDSLDEIGNSSSSSLSDGENARRAFAVLRRRPTEPLHTSMRNPPHRPEPRGRPHGDFPHPRAMFNELMTLIGDLNGFPPQNPPPGGNGGSNFYEAR